MTEELRPRASGLGPPRGAGEAGRPSAADLLKRVRRIEIATRKAVEDTLSGQYHSIFKGRGMAFSEVRPYAPGDEVRSIDWNVTARTGQLHVKRFVEERELTVTVLCDVSGSADFGSRERTKAEVAAELAALLAFSAVANGDRIGLVLFTDRVERFVPPRKGRRHALRIVSEILQARPEGRGTSVAAALEFLRRAMRRRTVAFLLSDFLEPAPDRAGEEAGLPFERALRIAARKHDVVPVRLSDRLESELPASGLAWVEDPETGAVVRIDLADRRVRARVAERLRAQDERLRKLFARLELDHALVRADDADYVTPLLAFFRARAEAGVSVVSRRRPVPLRRATPRRSRIRLRGLALALALAGPAPAADPGAEAHPLSFGSRASKAAAKLGEPFDYVVEVRHRTEEWYALPDDLSLAPFHAEGARCRRDERKEEAVTTCTMRLALFALGPVDVPDLALRVRTPAGPASLNVPGPRVTGTGVIDPAIPPEDLALRDIAPPAPLLLRSLRLLWWALGTAAAAALLFLAARALRRARAEREAAPPMPAAERFARRLDALEAEGLLERGEGRELVARLSVIVREYLGALTGLNALDLTTGELVERLRIEGDPRLDAVGLEVFLREADLVKFARQAAGREACAAVMAYARGLLERTRPHPGS